MYEKNEYIIAEWIQTEYGNILVDFKPPYKKYNEKIKENKE